MCSDALFSIGSNLLLYLMSSVEYAIGGLIAHKALFVLGMMLSTKGRESKNKPYYLKKYMQQGSSNRILDRPRNFPPACQP